MSDSGRWSHEVTQEGRHDVGGGVFATGSAREIADAVIAAARDDGSPETLERRAALEEAKEIVRADLA